MWFWGLLEHLVLVRNLVKAHRAARRTQQSSWVTARRRAGATRLCLGALASCLPKTAMMGLLQHSPGASMSRTARLRSPPAAQTCRCSGPTPKLRFAPRLVAEQGLCRAPRRHCPSQKQPPVSLVVAMVAQYRGRPQASFGGFEPLSKVAPSARHVLGLSQSRETSKMRRTFLVSLADRPRNGVATLHVAIAKKHQGHPRKDRRLDAWCSLPRSRSCNSHVWHMAQRAETREGWRCRRDGADFCEPRA